MLGAPLPRIMKTLSPMPLLYSLREGQTARPLCVFEHRLPRTYASLVLTSHSHSHHY
jgi:hypothetical protein